MKILSIETSCDETAVSIVQAEGDFPNAQYKVLGDALFSQAEVHREYGGVFPALAKREHAKTLPLMLQKALQEADMLRECSASLDQETLENIHEILYREPGMGDAVADFFAHYEKPDLDLIAVTRGPGLEPALWVGINFARALSYQWQIPVIPVNHMEGHVLASIFSGETFHPIKFPALALLISGGHTELVNIDSWQSYERIGATRDDAVGEAFDKVARMLGLSYPGGPEISARAERARDENLPEFIRLPRPMLDSGDLDFSFSGLKTAVRYAIEGKKLSEEDITAIARDFEDAVTEVLLRKTIGAIERHTAQTLIVGGGVSANKNINKIFHTELSKTFPDLQIFFPEPSLSTDNSVMIALVGHAHAKEARTFENLTDLKADGNLSLA